MNAIILLSFLIAGTFAEAGAHPKTYGLAHENGSKAVVDTKTATCISWKDVSGTELIGSAAIAHQFPTSTTPLKGEFIPEERAKKVSFDRMIFKVTPEGKPEIEYRADVTMRADSLEYDVVVKNYGASTHKVSLGLLINLSDAAKKLGYKVTSKKGYTSGTDFSVATGEWEVPVGKLKETEFYVKISK